MALLTVQQNLQQDAVASIDAAKVLIDKVLAVMEIFSTLPSLPLPYALNAQQLLMFLLEHLDVTYEELMDFLTRFITVIVPALEISTKAILLTNLKKMVSCSCDPRIPEKYRKIHKAPNDSETSNEKGIDIGLESIDFYNKLLISPLSDEGKNWYFGLDNVKDSYKFARAEDFDAFLWFVMHKGRFPNSSDFSSITGNVSPSGATLLEKVTLTYSDDTQSHVLPGNTFTYSGGTPHIISLCIEALYGKDMKIKENTLVPVSDDWNSVNWYIRRGDALTSNMGITKKNNRDYDKERAICNIQFLDQASSEESIGNGLVNNRFRFTILPKPYIHIPSISEGEPPWRFIKLTFDSKGNYDKNGKYSISTATAETYKDGVCKVGDCIEINMKSGGVTVTNPTKLKKSLFECYNGLTVYEFNYDYVMGMKLFDAKTITTTLLNSLNNIRLGLGLDFGWERTESSQKIIEIVKNIIENDDVSVDDCFFEFSNDKYDALLKNTDKIRAQKRDFSDVTAILNEYKDEAELNEQENIIKRAIEQTVANVTEGVEPIDEYKVRLNLITDMIGQLSTVLVTAVLSPKVLMLLEVNETLMGGKWEKFTFQDLMKSMREIIVAIVKEVRDLIYAELLKLVIEKLQPIIITINAAIVREQIEDYTEILDDIMRHLDRDVIGYANTLLNLFKTSESDTQLDIVDYADINTSPSNKEEKLPINNC